jgi:hypothetical protein
VRYQSNSIGGNNRLFVGILQSNVVLLITPYLKGFAGFLLDRKTAS